MELDVSFPNLAQDGFILTSPESAIYNCIAWAAGADNDWWWPDSHGVRFWPASVPRTETVEGFVAMFENLGYSICSSPQIEPSYEKVAIYCLNELPQHAAKQLPSGLWTSKLGNYVDIQHSLRGLEGSLYGTAVTFLKRPAKIG